MACLQSLFLPTTFADSQTTLHPTRTHNTSIRTMLIARIWTPLAPTLHLLGARLSHLLPRLLQTLHSMLLSSRITMLWNS
jgi:hypothetical protein